MTCIKFLLLIKNKGEELTSKVIRRLKLMVVISWLSAAYHQVYSNINNSLVELGELEIKVNII